MGQHSLILIGPLWVNVLGQHNPLKNSQAGSPHASQIGGPARSISPWANRVMPWPMGHLPC